MVVKIIKYIILVVILSGCNPLNDYEGVFYTNESANDRFEQSKTWNSQNGIKIISSNTDTYFMYFMADSHVGGTKNFDKIITSAITNSVLAVAMVGDISTGIESDYDTLKKHIPDESKLRIFTVPGNHDLFFNGWKKYFELFGASSYYFEVKTPLNQDLFICLDTGSGTLGSKQMEWLQSVLINVRPAFRHCIVLSHNHLFRYPDQKVTTPPIEELSCLLNLFLKYNVNMYFNGHDHGKETKIVGNTTFVTIGACTDTDLTPNYVKFSQQNGNLKYEFVKIK